ncbi:DsbA family protein [Prauserella oleivorans]|uniref:Disulfide bond formation protein n=2 Tax=Prauserella TaxID=142577 RepID=A0A318LGC0_9PSEU|nr:thioredoxin domain-containing protein [Prauserella flavalba]PXY25745.1 disulfide bond formation protein [Prauserella flavalba]
MSKTSGRDTWKRDAVLVVVLVLVAAGLITYLLAKPPGQDAAAPPGQPPSQEQAAAQGENPLANLARREQGDPLAIGDVDAPVTMVMYSDYRCPFCAKFSRDTEPILVERYVREGVLRIEWRDLPIFGTQSMEAARAGRAAAEQGRFWEFNRAVFGDSPPTGHPDLTQEKLRGYAREVGMPDMEKFTAAMDDQRFDEAIRNDLTEGASIGVSSTPTFVINGEPILGAQPLETFVSAIDRAAAQS